MSTDKLVMALKILNTHHVHFFEAQKYASLTDHPTPEDSRAWSQILVSVLTGTKGLARHKGPDLIDGSDVKSANAWYSIDKVRFNGVIKAGTRSYLSGSMAYLDQMPHLYFVMWDCNPENCMERARVWAVRPQFDMAFREVAQKWYNLLEYHKIISTNFQLHPPVNKNHNTFTNLCGDLEYPLLLNAEWNGEEYVALEYYPKVLDYGECQYIL